VSDLDDPFAAGDWQCFRAARDRFLARVRPEAMDDPPPRVCPDALPEGWRDADERAPDQGPAAA
jgi:hypothetical protein